MSLNTLTDSALFDLAAAEAINCAPYRAALEVTAEEIGNRWFSRKPS